MLPTGALAEVLVAHRDPRHAGFAAVAGRVRVGLDDAVNRAAPRPGLTGEGVDHAQEQVPRNVVQVAAERQPLACGRDVIGGALALRLQQHWQREEVVAIPLRERL